MSLLAAVGPSATVEVRTGADALRGVAADIDALQRDTGCPITARGVWQQTWAECAVTHMPLVITLREGALLVGAAPLAVRRTVGGRRIVVPLGGDMADAVRLPARPGAEGLLASAVIGALADLRPWAVAVRRLPAGDPVGLALAEGLPASVLRVGEPSPTLSLEGTRDVRSHVTRNHHQQVRRQRNRLGREGIGLREAQLRDPDAIAALWPEVERVWRARDRQVRGRSQLDHPVAGPFTRRIVARLAADGAVELTVLWLDGVLAAFVLCFVDGDARRMWSCRFDPRFARFGVGRLANDSALRAALADPSCHTFDWMRGVEDYKSSMSDGLEQTIDVLASSTPVLRTASAAAHHLRDVLRDARDREPWLEAALEPVLRTAARLRKEPG